MVREQRKKGDRTWGLARAYQPRKGFSDSRRRYMRKRRNLRAFRFYSLSDKVWRADVLAVAWQDVRRNGGAAGVDGQTVADIEAYGVDRWLGELARDLKEGTYRPEAVRQVLIPKKQRGEVPSLGHSLHTGPGDADGGSAGAVADIRGGPGARAVRLSAGTKCTRCCQSCASTAEHGPPGGGRRGSVRLLRPNSACRATQITCSARERRADIELGQGVAGDGGGGRRRQGRQTPHEPGASGTQGHPSGIADLPVAQ